MEDSNFNRGVLREYRQKVRHTCSVLGWALAVMVILNQLTGLLIGLIGALLAHYKVMGLGAELYKMIWSKEFAVAGSSILAYTLALPVVFAIMAHVPEVIPEKKRMRPGKFFLFFVLTMGSGYILNIAGNLINLSVAALTGRSMAGMNPVNNLLDGMGILTILYVSVIGPLIEEYLFRWKLLNRLRPLGEKGAILFSALMFGLMHGNITQLLYATAIGVVLGYVAVKTGRMKYNCLIHIMVNSYSALLALLLQEPVFNRIGLVLTAFVPLWMFGSMVAAIVIFCVNLKRTRLLKGCWPPGVEYRDFSPAMYLNSGVAAFAVLNLALAAYYLFAA